MHDASPVRARMCLLPTGHSYYWGQFPRHMVRQGATTIWKSWSLESGVGAGRWRELPAPHPPQERFRSM